MNARDKSSSKHTRAKLSETNVRDATCKDPRILTGCTSCASCFFTCCSIVLSDGKLHGVAWRTGVWEQIGLSFNSCVVPP